jgi:hypothetical protein
MVGARTTDLPLAASAAEVIVNEDIGGGHKRSARLPVAGLAPFIPFPSTRERLTAPRTYFVSPAGSNLNDGLTPGTAFLTPQRAVDVVFGALDLAGFNVDIQLADSTAYAGVDIASPQVGAGLVTLRGNAVTPANVRLTHAGAGGPGSELFGAVAARAKVRLHVRDVEVRSTTSGNGLFAQSGGHITYENVDFGSCVGAQVLATGPGSFIQATGNYRITGGAGQHYNGNALGEVRVQGRTVTLVGTPAFSSAFARADFSGLITANGNTYSGVATGQRYLAEQNGVIVTFGGANAFPGNVAGIARTSGLYDATMIGTTYLAQQGVQQVSLTDAATITWDAETQQCATVTLAGNRTLGAITNARPGFTYLLRVVQDATGGRTLNLSNAIYKFPGGTEPTLSAAPNAIDVLSFYFDGTAMLGSMQKALS